jgi:hypothetical protein
MKNTAFNIGLQDGFPPQVATDNTAIVAAACDLSGYEGATVVIQCGTLADADMTTTVLLEESDSSGSNYSAVADEDLIGTEAGAAVIFSDDLKIAKLGYKGKKRYIRLTVTPAANSSNAPLSSLYICQNPRSLQTTQIA